MNNRTHKTRHVMTRDGWVNRPRRTGYKLHLVYGGSLGRMFRP